MLSSLMIMIALSQATDHQYNNSQLNWKWTTTNTELELALVTLTIVDVMETRWFTTHTDIPEANPLMGRHPSAKRLYLMNALELGVHAGLMILLPHPFREAAQAASIAVELCNDGLVAAVVGGFHMQF